MARLVEAPDTGEPRKATSNGSRRWPSTMPTAAPIKLRTNDTTPMPPRMSRSFEDIHNPPG
jgi:hypothetical protein